MLALFLTILCSTSIALILKHNDTQRGNEILLLAGNYCVAAIISALFLFNEPEARVSSPSLFFGAILGILFVLSFFSFARAVSIAGTSLATLSSRLSVVVPLVLSVLIYHEYPTFLKTFGFLFTFITILFFYHSLRGGGERVLNKKAYVFLIAVLIGIGINDFCMKVFQQWRPDSEKPFFLLCIFGFAFVYSSAYIFLNKIKLDRKTLLLGTILGVPNMFSSYFMLSALAELPGIIVYPVTNIGIIVFTAVAAILIWREHLNISGRLALLSGIVAIVLLSI